MKYSIPFNINEEKISERQIEKLKRKLYMEMMNEKKKFFYFNPADLRGSAESFSANIARMSNQETEEAVLKFAEEINEIERQGDTCRIIECYDSLTTIIFSEAEKLPSSQQEILLEKLSELTSSKSSLERTYKCQERTFQSEHDFLGLLISISLANKVKGSEKNIENFLPQILKNI